MKENTTGRTRKVKVKVKFTFYFTVSMILTLSLTVRIFTQSKHVSDLEISGRRLYRRSAQTLLLPALFMSASKSCVNSDNLREAEIRKWNYDFLAALRLRHEGKLQKGEREGGREGRERGEDPRLSSAAPVPLFWG